MTSDEPEQIANDIRKSRNLLRWINDKALKTFRDSKCADPLLNEQVFAEVLFRLWLYVKAPKARTDSLAELCDAFWKRLPSSDKVSTRTLYAWLERNRTSRIFAVPGELKAGNFSRLGELLQKRLDTWKNAHGVIPFVGMENHLSSAVALPFFLQPTPREIGSGRVLGGDGFPIKGLNNSMTGAEKPLLQTIKKEEPIKPMDVWIPDIRADVSHKVSGESAGLPILFALYNQAGGRVLDPFKFSATGVVSQSSGEPDPTAQTVKTIACKVNTLREMGVSQIIVTGPTEAYTPGDDVMPCNSLTALHQCLRLAESMSGQKTAVESKNPLSIQQQLLTIEGEMKVGAISLVLAKTQLRELISALTGARDTLSMEVQTEAELLLATAECHLGNAEASLDLLDHVSKNHNVLGSFARTKALIRQAVNLSDFGRYEEAATILFDCLEGKRSSGLRGEEKMKLELDARGTLGQILTCQGLREYGKRSSAYQEIKTACTIASSLDEYRQEPKKTELPQDLCYLYQWHAFFDRSGCDAVWSQFAEITAEGHRSWNFMKCLRWLAAYRALLENQEFDCQSYEDDLPEHLMSGQISWLYRLSRKYRATLRIASGEIEAGICDFEDAIKLIDESNNAPILQFIGVSVAFEAWRSLGECAPQLANRYSEIARKTLEDDLGSFHHASYTDFLDYLAPETGNISQDPLYYFPH